MASEESEMQTQRESIDPEDIRIVTHDGEPALELPGGQVIKLNTHVTEWTHDSPRNGEPVEMLAEVDADEHAWWTLVPERSDLATPTTEQEFPRITVEPEVVDDAE